MSPGVVAVDLQIGASGPLPIGYLVGPNNPTLTLETLRAVTLRILTGSIEVVQVDGYGAVVGSETAVAAGGSTALAAGRWRVTYDGSGADSSPLFFS